MITRAIKNKVDKIWTDIWAGGITNPLTVIDMLKYWNRSTNPNLSFRSPLTKRSFCLTV